MPAEGSNSNAIKIRANRYRLARGKVSLTSWKSMTLASVNKLPVERSQFRIDFHLPERG